jgi:hypothetical protein
MARRDQINGKPPARVERFLNFATFLQDCWKGHVLHDLCPSLWTMTGVHLFVSEYAPEVGISVTQLNYLRREFHNVMR